MMKFKVIVGISEVRWNSAAGILEGLVERVDHGLNAAGDIIPWLIIRRKDGLTTKLAGTNDCLSSLELEVLNPQEV